MEVLLLESLERLCTPLCTADHIDSIYTETKVPSHWWQEIEESGFLDVLLPEDQGGAGLSLEQAASLFILMGKMALPVPLAQTQWARAALPIVGCEVPSGFISIAFTSQDLLAKSSLTVDVPFAISSDYVLVTNGTELVVLAMSEAHTERISHNSLMLQVTWTEHWQKVKQPTPELRQLAAQAQLVNAVILSALMSGAADKTVELSLDYAQQRMQFGRQIGRFQAVQALLAQLAQRQETMSMAVQLGCYGSTLFVQENMAFVAASRSSEAAPLIADFSHAVHGAIGITQECALHLYTRALREWRLALGADFYWEKRLGQQLMTRSDSLLSFLCSPNN